MPLRHGNRLGLAESPRASWIGQLNRFLPGCSIWLHSINITIGLSNFTTAGCANCCRSQLWKTDAQEPRVKVKRTAQLRLNAVVPYLCLGHGVSGSTCECSFSSQLGARVGFVGGGVCLGSGVGLGCCFGGCCVGFEGLSCPAIALILWYKETVRGQFFSYFFLTDALHLTVFARFWILCDKSLFSLKSFFQLPLHGCVEFVFLFN